MTKKIQRKGDSPIASKNALDGIRVLEFSTAATLPWACKCFADFGAQVIKVESTKYLDLNRLTGPYKDGIVHPDRSAAFPLMNTGKYSITLDLTKPRGVEVVKRLVSWADVVVQNVVWLEKRFGLNYEELRKIKPDIIMVNVSIYGQGGPYARVAAWGYATQASAGHAHLTGWPDRGPVNPGQTVTGDIVTPLYLVVASLAALNYKRRTGKGQNIDLTQLEPLCHILGPSILDYVINKRVQTSLANRDPDAAPHGVFRCQGDDKWCAIAVFTDEEWTAFRQAIGSPEWTKDTKFATLSSRKENEDELDRLVEQWTINYKAEEMMTVLQKAGVPAAAVQNISDVMDRDPQLKERQHFVPVEHTGPGLVSVYNWPFKLPKTPPEIRSAPCLGEHNEYVCTQILGMSDSEFVGLVKEGVLQ